MEIGISTLHGETVNPDEPKNFDCLFEFFHRGNLSYEIISSKLNVLNEMKKYPSIMIGAPEQLFTEQEFRVLREYVSQGGSLMIILKYGGNSVLDTNIGNLFPGTAPLDDMLINEQSCHRKIFQPLIGLSVKTDYLNFEGNICYDGGCTFYTEPFGNNDGFAVYPGQGNYSAISTRWSGGSYNYGPRKKPGAILVYRKIGMGSVLYWGSRWSFSNEMFKLYDNSLFYRRLLELFCPGIYRENLEQRLAQPQRHRLLHGYPMSSGMKKHGLPSKWKLNEVEIDETKPLAVGVIPHPYCKSHVDGCGFCTFPHEHHNSAREKDCVESVVSEIIAVTREYPGLSKREVSSIYFGGGTANIVSNGLFLRLCKTLASTLKISPKSEITLEGAPHYFSSKPDLVGILAEAFYGSKFRISIGVQTFDPKILGMMGRSILNLEGSVEKAVNLARGKGINVSADFLFNLPGQEFKDIENDVKMALQLGIEHICFYNLVCFEGLDTSWSKSPEIIEMLPERNKALENFLLLYELLLKNGYSPITVTDFSLRDSGERGRYIYEEDLRAPEKKDWLGFGPYAISMFTDRRFRHGIKLLNPMGSVEYMNTQKQYGVCWDKSFKYSTEDLKIFWITRHIKGCKIPLDDYRNLFGEDIEHDFPLAIDALLEKGLIFKDRENFTLAPEGMYYADSVAGIFSWMRVNQLTIHDIEAAVIKKNDWNISLAEWMG